jgi:hypothetical protein
VLLLHALLDLLVLLLQVLQLLIGLPQLLIMQAEVEFLVALHLLVFAGGAIHFELQVAVLDDEFVALVLQLLQVAAVVLLPLQQVLQLLLQPHLHLSSVPPVLLQDFLQVAHYILTREIVNSVGLIHVEGAHIGSSAGLTAVEEGSSRHQQLVLGYRVLGSVGLEHALQRIHRLLLDLVARQLYVEQGLVLGALELPREVVHVRSIDGVVPDLQHLQRLRRGHSGCDALEGLASDLVVGDVEPFEFGTGVNEGGEAFLPVVVLALSQVVVFDDELP